MARPCSFTALSLLLLMFLLPIVHVHGGGRVFQVKRKFAPNTPISELHEHDQQRHAHARLLANRPLDFTLQKGGLGLYYTEIMLGTPPITVRLHVDSGSELMIVYCNQCNGCPKIEKMPAYDPAGSKSARYVQKNEDHCKIIPNTPQSSSDPRCSFGYGYMDNRSLSGYYVNDVLTLPGVHDQLTQPFKANVTFGCVTKHTSPENLNSIQERSGIQGVMGLTEGSGSILSQLASAGKVQKQFSHCLDPVRGGGIFAIGHVVEPKVDQTVPLEKNQEASLKSIEVDGHFKEVKELVLFDSGTSCSWFPEAVYNFLMEKILSDKSNLSFYNGPSDLKCFNYSGSVDARFPVITFHFSRSTHAFKLYPHGYIVNPEFPDTWCIFGINVRTKGTGISFGEGALANKLVTYDLENRVMGWKEYNCSSSIKVEDESGGVCKIDPTFPQ